MIGLIIRFFTVNLAEIRTKAINLIAIRSMSIVHSSFHGIICAILTAESFDFCPCL